ncbi:lactococcin 972 family bacteriocin [Trueperella pyogenes]|uniref:lactococcin 972 family bacteriocin n=1 Tax=Trueperella pyogenes TaxID=1661 RepID=UPI00387353C6
MIRSRVRKVVASLVLAGCLTGSGVGLAIAGGAAGGDFSCDLTGVPRLGYVTSSYNHPTRTHWATAFGTGRKTVEKGPKVTAVATTGRALYGNRCFYGVR